MNKMTIEEVQEMQQTAEMKEEWEEIKKILVACREWTGQTVINIWLDTLEYSVEATGAHRHERSYWHIIPFGAWYTPDGGESEAELEEIFQQYLDEMRERFLSSQTQ